MTRLPAALLAAGVLAGTGPATAQEPIRKIRIGALGIYRIPFEDLGVVEALPSARVGISSRGREVPCHLDDGGDGELGPGDALEILGEPAERTGDTNVAPKGNVYLLSLAGASPARTRAGGKRPATALGDGTVYRITTRLEEDTVMVRFPSRKDGLPDENWYWTTLSHVASEPFRVSLQLDDLVKAASAPATVRVHLRGWSKSHRKPTPATLDHRVALSMNGSALGVAEWNGDAGFLFEKTLAAGELVSGANELALRVEARTFEGQSDPLVDVVLLNWVELSYPRSDVVPSSPVRLLAPDADLLSLTTTGPTPPLVMTDGGVRIGAESMRSSAAGGGTRHTFASPAGNRSLVVGAATAPPEIDPFDAGGLKGPNRADYIVIGRRAYLGKLLPLALAHTRRGLAVKVVSVEQVFDAFSGGLEEPRAIRDFLAHAYASWERPAPRYVLLAGDASWDANNELVDDANYAKWTYSEGQPGDEGFGVMAGARGRAKNDRRMIPSWSYSSLQGHSASDNFFACVDGDDVKPDLAIGRIPVARHAEVEGVVAKLVHFVEAPRVGPWRRRALFIDDGISSYRKRSESLAKLLGKRGYAPVAITPGGAGSDLARHQQTIRDALDQGQAIVHFLGHGGRFIWRTAAPDINAQRDLFTLEDLDRLVPSDRLPVVLSMTCYSAPFDHPSADSIGEKFLRLVDRGASAVLAASWRNSPTQDLSTALMEEMTRPGATIGEAVMAAKHRTRSQEMVQIYNLLGDPAMPLPVPSRPVALSVSREGGSVRASATLAGAAGFSGSALVEWVDLEQSVVATQELPAPAPDVELRLEGASADRVVGARVYMWSEESAIDGIGYGVIPGAEPPEEPAVPRSRRKAPPHPEAEPAPEVTQEVFESP